MKKGAISENIRWDMLHNNFDSVGKGFGLNVQRVCAMVPYSTDTGLGKMRGRFCFHAARVETQALLSHCVAPVAIPLRLRGDFDLGFASSSCCTVARGRAFC